MRGSKGGGGCGMAGEGVVAVAGRGGAGRRGCSARSMGRSGRRVVVVAGRLQWG